MKKLVMVLMVMMMLVGCSTPDYDKAKGTTPYGTELTDLKMDSVLFRAIEQYEGQAKPTVRSSTWTEEKEVVDGIKEGLYTIKGTYEHSGRIYELKVLMQTLPGGQYRLIRYHNLTTGKQLK